MNRPGKTAPLPPKTRTLPPPAMALHQGRAISLMIGFNGRMYAAGIRIDDQNRTDPAHVVALLEQMAKMIRAEWLR